MVSNSVYYLTENGRVYACGQNNYGQLGLGIEDSKVYTITEVPIPVAEKVKEMQIVSNSVYYLTENGRVYACGQNNNGKLGIGSEEANVYTITEVTIPVGEKVKEIQIDNNSVYYLTENGRVYACGNNSYGRLGIGSEETNVYTITEVPLPVAEKVKEIQIDMHSVYYLTENGKVYACGVNSNGQLGLGVEESNVYTATEVPIPVGEKLKEMQMATYSVYYLTENGRVYACGRNSVGQLGIGVEDSKVYTATEVPLPEGEKVKEMYSSTMKTYYLTENGRVYASGLNSSGGLGIGNDESFIYTATEVILPTEESVETVNWGNNIYYIMKSGRIYAIGSNSYGRLGVGSSESTINIPAKVLIPEGVKIKEIIFEASSTYYISEDEKIYVSGDNSNGQLGILGMDKVINVVRSEALSLIDLELRQNNKRIYITEDKQIYMDGKRIDILGLKESSLRMKEIRVEGNNCDSIYQLTENGEVYVWGENDYGQLGVNSTTSFVFIPTKVPFTDGVKIKEIKVAGSYSNSIYYLTEAGEIYVCGDNSYGELGIGSTSGKIYAVTKVQLPSPVKELIAGGGYMYCLCENGEVYVSGSNSGGSLGTGSTENKIYTATKVPIPTAVKEMQIVNNSVYYLTKTGRIYTCGNNGYGRLGVGSTKNRISTPTEVPLPGGVKIKEVIGNSYTTYYITENGRVYACGYNYYGQLGVGSTEENIYTATEVPLPEGVKIKEVIYDSNITRYIDENGKEYVCGDNKYGNLEIDSTESKIYTATETIISTGMSIKKKDKYYFDYSTSYLTENGEVYARGYNGCGELGVGSTEEKIYTLTRAALPENVRIKDIFESSRLDGYIFYLTEDGEVYASGRNNYGQLGVGSTDSKIYTPTRVALPEEVRIKDIILEANQGVYYLTEEGQLYASGRNMDGCLGVGSTEEKIYTPTRVALPEEVKVKLILNSGNSTRFYLTEDGEVYASGYNTYGQLGVGRTENKIYTVTKIPLPEGVVIKYIDSFNGSTYFLTEDGQVYASGYNTYGQLGIGSAEKNIYTATKIPLPEDVVIEKIVFYKKNTNSTAPLNRVYLISTDGTIYVSGENDVGQLGVGHTNEVRTITKMKEIDNSYFALGDITTIYGNSTSTIFEETDGDIFVVGDNTNGKLGITGMSKIETATKINMKGIKDVGIGNDFSVFLKDNGSIVGYGNSSKSGNGLTNIAQIAVGNNHSVFLTKSGQIIANGTIISGVDNAYKIVAGANHTVVLKKDGTTKSFGQAESGLTNVVDVFAGKNMTVFITSDNKTYIMENDTLTELTIKGIVYAELNGEKPYFVTYDRRLIDKDKKVVDLLGSELQWVKEVKGDVVLTERMRVYDLSKL